MPEGYNGYANYETWNVALWIQNDENLYSIATELKQNGYEGFVEYMTNSDLLGELSKQTPDGVSWTDSKLDKEELNNLFEEL